MTTYDIPDDVVTAFGELFASPDLMENVFASLTQREANVIADMLEATGSTHAATVLIQGVWEAEDPTERDPEPWLNGHGSRRAELDDDAQHNEGDERFRFVPRTFGELMAAGVLDA